MHACSPACGDDDDDDDDDSDDDDSGDDSIDSKVVQSASYHIVSIIISTCHASLDASV